MDKNSKSSEKAKSSQSKVEFASDMNSDTSNKTGASANSNSKAKK